MVLSGHTHERTAWPILEGDVIVVEPGCFGSFLGRLDLVIKPGGGVATHDFRLIPILASRYDEDAKVKVLVDRSLAPHRARMAKQAGRTETVLMRYDLLETTADDFIADAVRETANTDIGFTNGFRFGVPVPPETITEADLWNLLPNGRANEARLDNRQRTQRLLGTRAGNGVLEKPAEAEWWMGSASFRNDHCL